MNDKDKYELIKFRDGNFSLDVKVSPNEDTVWLTQKQMSILYDISVDNVSLHIKNVFKDLELDNSVVEESSVTASDGKKYKTKIYNLDMVLAVGYRVKSKNAILFRKWANKLKQYLLKGHAINEKRCLSCTSNILDLQTKFNDINNKVTKIEDSLYSINDKLIYEGKINDGELESNSTCAESAHMRSLGVQKYKLKLYNLDMIISVGYRVNSKRGIMF